MILPLVLAFEAIVDEQQAGSILTLRVAFAAVLAGIVVFHVVVDVHVVAVEREGRCCGKGAIVGGWKQENP
jgi:hypothetical protein